MTKILQKLIGNNKIKMNIDIKNLIELNNKMLTVESEFNINKREFINKLQPFTDIYIKLLKELIVSMAKKYLTEKVKYSRTQSNGLDLSSKVSSLFNTLGWIERFDSIDVSISCGELYIDFIEEDTYYREKPDEIIKSIKINELFFDEKFIKSEVSKISEEFETKLKNIFLEFNDTKKKKIEEMKSQKENLERLIKDLENE